MITDVEGVEVGHWSDHEARTGCTAVLFPEGTVASGEVRGGAPATREFDLLEPHRLVRRLDAVVLAGGSAFGLAAADGAMRWLSQRDRGFDTGAGRVPIVVGMALFDLFVGDPTARPGAEEGYAACEEARTGEVELGQVGAGSGASVGFWMGPDAGRPGGITSATVRHGDVVVSSLVAVNAFGDVDDGNSDARFDESLARWEGAGFEGAAGTNTTIGVLATNAAIDKAGCLVAAQGAHDGLARALFPPHGLVDGDAFVVGATGRVPASLDLVRAMALRSVERAIRSLA